MADPFHLAEDPQQISAENLVDIFCAVATIQQGLGDFGQVGGGVPAFGQGAAEAIEI
jgi:hypothetical protein